jgi:hypothetical protein
VADVSRAHRLGQMWLLLACRPQPTSCGEPCQYVQDGRVQLGPGRRMLTRTSIFVMLALALLAAGCAEPPIESFAEKLPDPGTDLRFTCGGFEFSPNLLAQPAFAERGTDPLEVALHAFLAEPAPDVAVLPDAGWHLVSQDGQRAWFLAQSDSELPFAEVGLEHKNPTGRYDGWQVTSWDQCRPGPVLPGFEIASWKLDRGLPLPKPTNRQFVAIVEEDGCDGVRPWESRVAAPMIRYGPEGIVVIFGVRPVSNVQVCEANRFTARVLVRLDQPIGDRRLLDGSALPPLDPAAREPWEMPSS